ncbi:hypothetical protein BHM03_00030780 [Ensete ventricosum]|uniref:Probable magnesium transporter n=1 Tax=Ensete ventricosum TaxID=4639 RepID=A0A445MIB5_ENSVE|nr:hypothetical protein BHM03_00030780 [Ensete ventricosum]
MDQVPTNSGQPPAAGSSHFFADNLKGFLLAVASSAFIGASFIIKKKGLKRAGASGSRAGTQPLPCPLLLVFSPNPERNNREILKSFGECRFRLMAKIYYFLLVFMRKIGGRSAVLAHFILKEKLQRMGVLGCVLCIVGSTIIVLHAPEERTPSSVQQIWDLATQPGILQCLILELIECLRPIHSHTLLFVQSIYVVDHLVADAGFLLIILSSAFLLYTASAVAVSLVLMLHCSPRYGQTNIMVYLGICSAIGSLTVISAIIIVCLVSLNSLHSSSEYFISCAGYEYQGHRNCNQAYIGGCQPSWLLPNMGICNGGNLLHYNPVELLKQGWCLMQNLLFRAVSQVSYANFFAHVQDWSGQSASNVASEICGLITVISGTTVLHSTRESDQPFSSGKLKPPR